MTSLDDLAPLAPHLPEASALEAELAALSGLNPDPAIALDLLDDKDDHMTTQTNVPSRTETAHE